MHCLATALALYISAVGQATSNLGTKDPQEARETERKHEHPLAGFERLTRGEWRVTFESGTSQFDTWDWGPGGHSIVNQTYGSDAAGAPWRSVDVYFWDPDRHEVRLLGLRPDIPGLGRGFAEGTMQVDGERANASFDLYQPGFFRQPRTMGLTWAFSGTDRYRETLLEATPTTDLQPLAAWDYVRSATRTSIPETATDPQDPFKAFAGFLDLSWETSGDWAGTPLRIRTSFEWVPRIDAVQARVVTLAEDGQATPLLEAFFYHHPTQDTLHVLALAAWGQAYEGRLSAEDALLLDLGATKTPSSSAYRVHLDRPAQGSFRSRIWSVEEEVQTLQLDLEHRPPRATEE